MLRSAIAEADYLNNPILKEVKAAEKGMAGLSMMKEDLVREFNEEVKAQNSSNRFQWNLPMAGSYEDVVRYLEGTMRLTMKARALGQANLVQG